MLAVRHHRGILAWVVGSLGLLAVAAARPALAQGCLWDDSSPMEPPLVTPLGAWSQGYAAPGRLAADGTGNLYVADPAAGRVLVVDSGGAVLGVKSGLLEPSAVAVGSDGSIYVAQAGSGSVAVFDGDWNFVQYLGKGAGEFVLPNDIAVDPEAGAGRIYVSDGGSHQVRVYSTSGALEFVIGQKGSDAGQFDFPVAIHVARVAGPPAATEILVADQNNDRVQIFDPSGAYLRCFGGSASRKKFGRIIGLTGDDVGRIYVADVFQAQVLVFDPQLGAPLGTIGSFGSGTGQLRTPQGLVIDAYGRLMVSSVNNGRVEQFGLDDFTEPPPTGRLFQDGFETGDLDLWSNATP